MRKRVLVRSVAACSVVLLSSAMARAGDNWIGTWKLNTKKSTFSPGPAPKSQTLKFEPSDGGIKLTSHRVNADGKAVDGTYVSKWDGKDVPWKGNPDADTSAPKRTGDNSYVNTWKKAGKKTVTAKATVSADGKVLTIVQTGKDAQGRTVNTTQVYDKQ